MEKPAVPFFLKTQFLKAHRQTLQGMFGHWIFLLVGHLEESGPVASGGASPLGCDVSGKHAIVPSVHFRP